ncbi:MAG TPA: APC family permease [Polyangia bacterium]|jgi:amino acid transporter
MAAFGPARSFRELLFGRSLRTDEQEEHRVGTLTGVPLLGLDALASAAYGPEAALAVLMPLGVMAAAVMGPLTVLIVALLLVVALSYRESLAAYPSGGGSYSIAKENLGRAPGLVAAAALVVDYVLNVAVAISAAVGALVSALPTLLPHTLPLCLGFLGLITVVNLRGVREAGLVFLLPTYAFVLCLGLTLVGGLAKTLLAHGHPHAVAPPPAPLAHASAASLWLLVRAFASGCTALTGIEAVSNGVPLFRDPAPVRARRALGLIVGILVALLVGIAALVAAYGLHATPPARPGYESMLSQLVGAVAGRGVFYYVTMATILGVLYLSANTSFAGFPRLCHVLALDDYLPAVFAIRGRRLVYSSGVIALAVLAGALLIAFRGITDQLIPLFAVGAFLAFTMSQLGMAVHWRRRGGERPRAALGLNLAGAVATAVILAVVAVTRFRGGAWVGVLAIPALLTAFVALRRYHVRVAAETLDEGAVDFAGVAPPLVVVPIRRLDRVARKALRFAAAISPDVRAVQVLNEEMKLERLAPRWGELVEQPARAAGIPPPRLVVLPSAYRELVGPLLEHVRELARAHPDRSIAVLVPELVQRRWYHFVLHNHRAALLNAKLRLRGGEQIVVIAAPWYARPR